MRVISGELRGRRLVAPPPGERGVRPTPDRVREALFSILGSLQGQRILDLFAGTGALGIEAVSRGAAEAVLVDVDPGLAERNVRDLDLAGRCEVVRSDALEFLSRAEGAFDLVLCDPPYRLADRLGHDLDQLLPQRVTPGGRVVVETHRDRPLVLSLPLDLERSYGATLISIYGPRPVGDAT